MKFLFLLLLSFSAFAEKNINIELKRPDGEKIFARLRIPDEKLPFTVLLHLQGSSCVSVKDRKYELHPRHQKKNYALLTIEKPGLSPDMVPEDCFKDSYLLKNNVFTRKNDALHVLNFIQEKLKWNQELILVGESEGTLVATLVAEKKTPKALGLFAGANGMTMEEEFYTLIKKKKKPCGFESQEELKKKIEQIHLSPTSKQTWCSSSSSPNSYQWWSKILRLSVLPQLLSFDFPIFVAHGSEDEMVPMESSAEVERHFERHEKKNLVFKRYEGLNHKWRDPKGEKKLHQVMSDFDEWLGKL